MPEAGGTLRSSALEIAPMVSYAGNQEDVRLRRVAGLLPTCIYVDVGAGDPVVGSVTYWLYTQGWRGVLVEPGSRAEVLQQARPEDVVVEAAVGPGPGDVVLYETTPDAGMSTTRVDRLAEVLALGQAVRERRMPVVSLSDVFARAGGQVSVLSVDVEGAEGAVLGSLDWQVHRPVVVVVEAILPWQAVSTRAEFEQHLLDAGYPEVAFDGVNTYYVDSRREDHAELAAALAYPVSLLDRWEPHAAVLAREAAGRAEDDAREAHARAAQAQDEADRMRTQERRLAAALQSVEDELEQERRLRAQERRLAAVLQGVEDELEQERRLRRQAAAMADAETARAEDLAVELAHMAVQLDREARQAVEKTQQLEAVLASTTWRYGAPVAHALTSRLRVARRAALSRPGPGVAALRRAVSERVDQARLNRAGPSGRAALAVVRHTHPAFLTTAPDVPLAPSGYDWKWEAAAVQRDDDDSLRERLEQRDGVRNAQERSVMLAALAQAVSERGVKSSGGRAAVGDAVLVDARSLQDPGLAHRGIGHYARELVRALALTGAPVLLYTDPALPALAGEVALLEAVDVVDAATARRVRWLVQPSPMTHDQWPLAVLLDDDQVWCTAIGYDIIPSRYPDVYLPSPAAALHHAAREQALRLYDELLVISHATRADLAHRLGAEPAASSIVWPSLEQAPPAGAARPASRLPQRYLLLASGHEHRKNLVAGLGAAALLRHDAATADLEVVVMGWSGPRESVTAWARDAGLADEVVHVLPYVDEHEASAARRAALAALVPSFAEGLSLPVIECVQDGCPVVASAIAPHRELLGDGPWLADPARPDDLARAVRHVLEAPSGTASRQRQTLATHDHLEVQEAVAARVRALAEPARSVRFARRPVGARPSLGVVTPWPLQRSGIADYSQATLAPLARSVDLTLHVSASARRDGAPGAAFAPASTSRLDLAGHDVLLTVMGNSHFHLPGLEVLEARGGVALCHDVRLTELNSYVGLEDGPAARAAGSGRGEPSRRTLRHELDAAPSLGFAHVARHSRALLFHSASTAARVARETGVQTRALPFVPYRQPDEHERTPEAREAARRALGLEGNGLHLGLVGGVDIRTKAADVVLEAHAWLLQWGHDVVLHVVGGVEPVLQLHLEQIVASAGTGTRVRWHGHVDDPSYRTWLVALDLGVQLRTSAVLTLSGAAADLAAFGVPAVTTRAMAEDMGLPEWMQRVPDDFSPLLVAEALEAALQVDPGVREEQRVAYLSSHSVAEYGRALLDALGMGGA